MSHIPNSAMPHATAEPQQQQEGGDGQERGSTVSRGYDAVKDKAKQYPKTAIAAGAAVVVGAVAAAALPLVRGKSGSGGGTKKKTTASKSSSGSGGKSGGSKA